MTAAQEWELTIATPIGRQLVTLSLQETEAGLTGEARGKDETVPLLDLTRDGNRLTWTQRITRPMRLNLTFDVTITDDHLAGTSKAGRLPRSTVSGSRTTGTLES